MAFTNHLRDDDAQYRRTLYESTGPLRYVMQYPPCESKRTNKTMDPRIQGVQVKVCDTMPLVDVDSELLGITKKAGYASQFQAADIVAKCSSNDRETFQGETVDGPTLLDSEDCRYSNPPGTLRGTGINRFEWLCRDPQETALVPHRAPVNYRLVAKDNHRPLLDVPIKDIVPPMACDADVTVEAFTDTDLDKDIQSAVASYPPLPPTQHWRDFDEIQRIVGRYPAKRAPYASEECAERLPTARVRY